MPSGLALLVMCSVVLPGVIMIPGASLHGSPSMLCACGVHMARYPSASPHRGGEERACCWGGNIHRAGKLRLRGGAGLASGGYVPIGGHADARADDEGVDGRGRDRVEEDDGGGSDQHSSRRGAGEAHAPVADQEISGRGAEESPVCTARSIGGNVEVGLGSEASGGKGSGELAESASESARLETFRTFPPQSMFPLTAERLAAAGADCVCHLHAYSSQHRVNICLYALCVCRNLQTRLSRIPLYACILT